MKVLYRSILVPVLVAAILASCVGRVRRPEVTLQDIRVQGIGLRGASLIADLQIDNRNDFDIETDSITYELFAQTSPESGEWSRILQRTYNQRIRIEEDEVTRVEIPIEFNYSEMSGAVRSILDRGSFNYRVQGHVYVREPLRRRMPFAKTGSVSLSGAR